MQRLSGKLRLEIAIVNQNDNLIGQEEFRQRLLDKAHHEFDAWGNRFLCATEEKDNQYMIRLVSSGNDQNMNTFDDIVYNIEYACPKNIKITNENQ